LTPKKLEDIKAGFLEMGPKGSNLIGWGVQNPNLKQDIKRRVLLNQPHKNAFNHGNTRCNYQMETLGIFSQKLDNWLGINYHDLDQLPVR